MKKHKTKILKRVIAIFLALTIVFGLSYTVVSAEETPVEYIDVSNKILYISSTGWNFQGQSEKAFTGNYFLYGTSVDGIFIESGEHNVTIHNLNLIAPNWCSALSVAADAILNLTAIGVNELVGYNHAGITGTEGATVNLVVEENSSLFLDMNYNLSGADYSVFSGIIFNISPGTSADNLDMTTNKWRKNELTISKGTPKDHNTTGIGDASGHYIYCNDCTKNISGNLAHNNVYKKAENGHISVCTVCGYSTDEVFEHTFSLVGNSIGHRIACSACGYYDANEVLENHIPVYSYTNSAHSASCSICNYVISSDESHNWKSSIITDSADISDYHSAECTECGFQTQQTHDMWYESCEGGHVYICYGCRYTDNIVSPHTDTYYDYVNSEYCAEFCADCNDRTGDLIPHNMSYFEPYDETHCVALCDNCGYYDIETTLSEHKFTDKYVSLDSESCAKACLNCGTIDYENAEPHVNGSPVTVEPTADEPGYTAIYCEKCNEIISKTYMANTISVIVSDIDNTAWENSGLLLYVDGVPTDLIRYMGNEGTIKEYYAINYDSSKSYTFKFLSGSSPEYCIAKINYIDSEGIEKELFSSDEMYNFSMLETLVQLNTADYTAVDNALSSVPQTFEEYTPDSVDTLVAAIKRVKRMLPLTKQAQVNNMAKLINDAVAGLKLNPDNEKIPNGVINSKYSAVEIYQNHTNDDNGYYLYDINGAITSYDYVGDYTVIDTNTKENENESYVNGFIDIISGKVNIDIVNFYNVSDYYSPIYLDNETCNVTLNLYGANASVSTAVCAGINVPEGAELTIEDKGGNLVAIGWTDCAGIGSAEYEDAGSITINGGTIFALSKSDGAGIGSGYDAGFDTITINDGTIWAECLKDDGSGIGVGDDGNGGDIIINGGNITALSVDDDGAGIGGADNGSVETITINGGTIVAGSKDAAAIGSGQDSDSSIGQITINGGSISASKWHDPNEMLIGKGNSNSQNENEYNFVHINGGTINTEGSKGIDPKPRKKTEVPVNNNCEDGILLDVTLSNGEKVLVAPENGIITLYLHDGVTVESIKSETLYYNIDINFTSFGGNTDTLIEIFAHDDASAPSYSYSAVGTKTGIKYTGAWSIESIEAGKYTMRVSKANHATREYEIEVDASVSTIDVKINLIGDISGDGYVKMNDLSLLNAHVKETAFLDGYALVCADITGDGFIKVNDLSRINAHVKETNSLWNF